MFEITLETEQLHDLSELLAKTVHESLTRFYPPGGDDVPEQLSDGGVWVEDSGEDDVVFADMRMPASFFEEFEIEEPQGVGIPWKGNPGIQDIASKASGKYVTMRMNEDDHYVHFHGSDGMHFKLSPTDADSLHPSKPPTARWPDFEYAFTYDTTIADFMNAIGAVELATEDAKMIVKEEWDPEEYDDDVPTPDEVPGLTFLHGHGDNHESTSPPLGAVEEEGAELAVETAFDTGILRSFIKPIDDNKMTGHLGISMLETITRESDGSVMDGTELWLPATFTTSLYGDIDTDFTVAPINQPSN